MRWMRRCFVVLVAAAGARSPVRWPRSRVGRGHPRSATSVNAARRVQGHRRRRHRDHHRAPPRSRPVRLSAPRAPSYQVRGSAQITVHADRRRPIRTPMAIAFPFNGVTPYGRRLRAKQHRRTRRAAVRAAERAAGGDGQRRRVWWDCYRALVSNVVLLDTLTGQHLAQWNIWQPGARYRSDVPIDVAAAVAAELAELADVAARTFPLACPPSVTPHEHRGVHRREPLAGTFRATTSPTPTAWCSPRATTTNRGLRHADSRCARRRRRRTRRHARPAVELSKMYVLPDSHGAGVSAALMSAALQHALDTRRRVRVAGRQPAEPTRATLLRQARLHGQRHQDLPARRPASSTTT